MEFDRLLSSKVDSKLLVKDYDVALFQKITGYKCSSIADVYENGVLIIFKISSWIGGDIIKQKSKFYEGHTPEEARKLIFREILEEMNIPS